MPVDPPVWAESFVAVRPRACVKLALRHLLHKADVVVFG